MSKLQKSRELLREYLQNTPKNVLQKKFDKYNNMSCEGVTLHEYISLFEKHYDFIHKTNSQYDKKVVITEWQSKTRQVQVVNESLVNVGKTPKQLESKSDTFDNNVVLFKDAA